MKRIIKHSAAALAVAAAIAAPAAYATNGYFLIGYGAKSRGMGGVGIALPQDSLAAAANPAGISFVGNGADFGLELFSPRRQGEVNATNFMGSDSGLEDNSSNIFAVPNGGYVHHMGGGLTFGVSVTGAGGMNTRYDQNVYANAFGSAMYNIWTSSPPNGLGQPASTLPVPPDTGTLGVNLSQAIVAPTIAFKVNNDNSIGASLLVAYQQFRAYGLGMFMGFSSDPTALTNNGNDGSWGAGVRLGWTGKINNKVTLGATWASKIYMQKFNKYKGLFAGQGSFDIPSNFGVGISVKADPSTTVAFDVERILYSGVKSIHNPGPTAAQLAGGMMYNLEAAAGMNPPSTSAPTNLLGSDNGYGFGWNSQTVYKLGVQYKYNDQWTFRGGVNYAKSPIPNSQVFFNVLAPGVVQTHLTLGFSYSPSRNGQVSVAYMHAFQHDQSYTYSSGGMSYTTKIGMYENSLEASYEWKF